MYYYVHKLLTYIKHIIMEKVKIILITFFSFLILMSINITLTESSINNYDNPIINLNKSYASNVQTKSLDAKSCSSGATWEPMSSYRECSGCTIIRGWEAIEVLECE